MRADKKFLLIIPAFIILLGGIYGGLKAETAASPEIKKIPNKITDSDISGLMASMNIQQLAEPVNPPDFNLQSTGEEHINLRQHRGNVVLLSFWATW
jgi:hypothetical protein